MIKSELVKQISDANPHFYQQDVEMMLYRPQEPGGLPVATEMCRTIHI